MLLSHSLPLFYSGTVLRTPRPNTVKEGVRNTSGISMQAGYIFSPVDVELDE